MTKTKSSQLVQDNIMINSIFLITATLGLTVLGGLAAGPTGIAYALCGTVTCATIGGVVGQKSLDGDYMANCVIGGAIAGGIGGIIVAASKSEDDARDNTMNKAAAIQGAKCGAVGIKAFGTSGVSACASGDISQCLDSFTDAREQMDLCLSGDGTIDNVTIA